VPPLPDLVPLGVVVTTADRPEALARCLDALLAGLHAPAEVVVVDAGDARRTAEVLAPRRDHGSDLVHVVHGRSGTGAARNRGVARCTQPLVALLADDAAVAPGWVPAVVAAAGRAGRAVLVAGGPYGAALVLARADHTPSAATTSGSVPVPWPTRPATSTCCTGWPARASRWFPRPGSRCPAGTPLPRCRGPTALRRGSRCWARVGWRH
jgi:glycosyltransferase involved in cell wall biosynthesis